MAADSWRTYGDMLAAENKALAQLGALAYGPAAEALAPPAGGEPRLRRLGLLAGGMALSALLDVPANYVEGHVLERRYALSKQSGRDWAVDQVKSFAVSTAISLPLLENVLPQVFSETPRELDAVLRAMRTPG